jgi:hypothetical protein
MQSFAGDTPMLDAGMAEFQAEMQGRSSTRRADELDNLSAPGAQRLAQIIKAWWSAAGFDNIRTEIVHSGGSGEAPVWGVRSNLRNALPPHGGANGDAR